MAEYREIQGAAIQSLANNTGTLKGQVWYDTTNYKFKVESVSTAGAWTSAPTIGAPRSGGMMFAAGTQTATVIAGGANPGSPPPDYTQRTDEYNGTAWSQGNNYTRAASNSLTSAGILTAALMAGGYSGTTGGDNFVEDYDGTCFTAGTAMSNTREAGMGGGTSTAMFVTSGGPIGGQPSTTEEWNGSSWSGKGAIPGTAQGGGGSGTTAAGLVFGGMRNYPGTVSLNQTMEYASPTWTASNNMNTPLAYRAPSMAGTQAATLAAGGNNRPPGGKVTSVEEYDGTCWSTTTAIPTATDNAGGTGTISAALMSGGNAPSQTNTSFEWHGAGSLETRTITTS